eukprot:17976-Heterococcus_DN1.PRE.2
MCRVHISTVFTATNTGAPTSTAARYCIQPSAMSDVARVSSAASSDRVQSAEPASRCSQALSYVQQLARLKGCRSDR